MQTYKWEKETKSLYQERYKELCEIEEIAAAIKVKELICDVDCELKTIERLYIVLEEIEWYISVWTTIYDNELYDKYKEKTKKNRN